MEVEYESIPLTTAPQPAQQYDDNDEEDDVPDVEEEVGAGDEDVEEEEEEEEDVEEGTGAEGMCGRLYSLFGGMLTA